MNDAEFSRQWCAKCFAVTVVHVHPTVSAEHDDDQERPQQDSNLRTRLRRPKCCTEMLTHGNLDG
jgi:hypothetical protein